MNKIKSIILVTGIGIIVSLFTLSFFGVFYNYEDYCGQYFSFEYDEQDYVSPIKEVKEYLSSDVGNRIDVDNMSGYGSSAPNADPPIPTKWHIQIQDRWMKTTTDIEIIKNSLENNPKIHNLQGPFSICEILDRMAASES